MVSRKDGFSFSAKKPSAHGPFPFCVSMLMCKVNLESNVTIQCPAKNLFHWFYCKNTILHSGMIACRNAVDNDLRGGDCYLYDT